MHLDVRSPFPGHEKVGERITDQDEIKEILASSYAEFVVRVAEPILVEDDKA